MTNAHKILDHYNDLDQLFAKALNQPDCASFRDKVRDLASKNAVVKRYRDDLFQLGNLRNAVAHQTKGGVPIAEPFMETVQLIQKILDEFKNPKRVIPAFQFEVYSVTPDTPLINLQQEMKAQNFSQESVLDAYGKVIEVIPLTRSPGASLLST